MDGHAVSSRRVKSFMKASGIDANAMTKILQELAELKHQGRKIRIERLYIQLVKPDAPAMNVSLVVGLTCIVAQAFVRAVIHPLAADV